MSRKLSSRAINGMLRRLTSVEISDYGCAFNAYRRSAFEPVLHRIGRQKFTKALCSRRARRWSRSTCSTMRARAGLEVLLDASHASRAARALRVLAAADPVGRAPVGDRDDAASLGLATTASIYWTVAANFPGMAFLGVARARRAGGTGPHRMLGEYVYPHPARCRAATALRDPGDPRMTRVLVTGGAGFISSNLVRHLLRAHRSRGRGHGRADLCGQHGQPRRSARGTSVSRSSKATSVTGRTSRRSSRAWTRSSTPRPSRTSRSRSSTARASS